MSYSDDEELVDPTRMKRGRSPLEGEGGSECYFWIDTAGETNDTAITKREGEEEEEGVADDGQPVMADPAADLIEACREVLGRFPQCEKQIGPAQAENAGTAIEAARAEFGDLLEIKTREDGDVSLPGSAGRLVDFVIRRKSPPDVKELQRWLALMLLRGVDDFVEDWSFLWEETVAVAKGLAKTMGLCTSGDVRVSNLFDGKKSFGFVLSMQPVLEPALPGASAFANEAPAVELPQQGSKTEKGGAPSDNQQQQRFASFPELIRPYMPDLEKFGNSPFDEKKLRFVVPNVPVREMTHLARLLIRSFPVRYEIDEKTGEIFFRRAIRPFILRFVGSVASAPAANRPRMELSMFLELGHLQIEADILATGRMFVYYKANHQTKIAHVVVRSVAKPELSKNGYTMLYNTNERSALTPNEMHDIRQACVKMQENLSAEFASVKIHNQTVTKKLMNSFLSSVPLWQDLGLYAERVDDTVWHIRKRQRRFEYYHDGLKKFASEKDAPGGLNKFLVPLPPGSDKYLLADVERYAADHNLSVSVTGEGAAKVIVVRRHLPPPPPVPELLSPERARLLYLEVADGQQNLPPGWTCRFSEQAQQFLLFDHLSRRCYRADSKDALAQFSRQIHTGLAYVRASVELQQIARQQPQRLPSPPSMYPQHPQQQQQQRRQAPSANSSNPFGRLPFPNHSY